MPAGVKAGERLYSFELLLFGQSHFHHQQIRRVAAQAKQRLRDRVKEFDFAKKPPFGTALLQLLVCLGSFADDQYTGLAVQALCNGFGAQGLLLVLLD